MQLGGRERETVRKNHQNNVSRTIQMAILFSHSQLHCCRINYSDDLSKRSDNEGERVRVRKRERERERERER